MAPTAAMEPLPPVTIDSLGTDVFQHIFKFLDPTSEAAAALVCLQFRDNANKKAIIMIKEILEDHYWDDGLYDRVVSHAHRCIQRCQGETPENNHTCWFGGLLLNRIVPPVYEELKCSAPRFILKCLYCVSLWECRLPRDSRHSIVLPNGNIATLLENGDLWIVDTTNGTCHHQCTLLDTHGEEIQYLIVDVFFSKGHFILQVAKHEVHSLLTWSVGDKEELIGKGDYCCKAIIPIALYCDIPRIDTTSDGKIYVARNGAFRPFRIELYDVESGKLLQERKIMEEEEVGVINKILVSEDELIVVREKSYKKLIIYGFSRNDLSQMRLISEKPFHGHLDWRPPGRWIVEVAFGYHDNSKKIVRAYSIGKDGVETYSGNIPLHRGDVLSISDSNLFVYNRDEATMDEFDLTSGAEIRALSRDNPQEVCTNCFPSVLSNDRDIFFNMVMIENGGSVASIMRAFLP